MKTLRELLKEGEAKLAGLPTPQLDAAILLGFVTKRSRLNLIAHGEETVSDEVAAHYEMLLAQRVRRVPVAYLLGTKEFYGREFSVSSSVLVPRPETELIVEEVLKVAEAKKGKTVSIVDLGTGSGCIAITVALELEKKGISAQVTAVDISTEALQVAHQNAERLGAKVEFLLSDWFSGIHGRTFDIIVSNPPYIGDHDTELSPELQFEPPHALFSGAEGLDAVRTLIEEAPALLAPSGVLFLEIGKGQSDIIKNEFSKSASVEAFKDFSGVERVIRIAW